MYSACVLYMNEHDDIIYGFGFYTANITPGAYAAFVLKHKDAWVKDEYDEECYEHIAAMEKMRKEEDVDKFYASIHTSFDAVLWEQSCKNSDCTGYLAVISNIMSEETGIRFSFESGEFHEAIMFIERFPWAYTENERNLTNEKLKQIVSQYAKELDVPFGECRVEHLF